MRYYLVALLLSAFFFGGCYDTAYNPDYIISDTVHDGSEGSSGDEEEP